MKGLNLVGYNEVKDMFIDICSNAVANTNVRTLNKNCHRCKVCKTNNEYSVESKNCESFDTYGIFTDIKEAMKQQLMIEIYGIVIDNYRDYTNLSFKDYLLLIREEIAKYITEITSVTE